MGVMPGQAVGRPASPASQRKQQLTLFGSETVKGRALWAEGAVLSGKWKHVTVGYTIKKG